MVETLIAEMRASVTGELTSRTQVVDHLLDLRLAARNRDGLLSVIDRLLEELPGHTTVPNSWWLAGLADLERAWLNLPMAATRPPPPSAADPSAPPPLPRRRRLT